MSSTLVSKLAKVYDSKTLQQKHVPVRTAAKPPGDAQKPPPAANDGLDLMQTRIESLSSKMDKLIDIQETVLHRVRDLSQDMETLREGRGEVGEGRGDGDVTGLCREMSAIMSAVNERSEQQSCKLEGMERLVLGIQQVIAFIGEAVKSSRLMELIFNKPPSTGDGEKPAPKEKPVKLAAKEKPSKTAVKEKPTKPASKEKNPKGHPSKERPGRFFIKEKVTEPHAEEKLVKSSTKEKPARSTATEKPAKPAAKERLTKFATKMILRKPEEKSAKSSSRLHAKITAKVTPAASRNTEKPSEITEKQAKSSPEETSVEPAVQEKPVVFTDKSRKTQKRRSLTDLLRERRGRDVKETARLTFKGPKSQKKKKPPDADTISLKKQALLLEEVRRLNQQNVERCGPSLTPEPQEPREAASQTEEVQDQLFSESEEEEVGEEGNEEEAEEEERGEEEEERGEEEEEEEEERGEVEEEREEERGEEEEEREEEEGEEEGEREEVPAEGPLDSEEVSSAPEDVFEEISPCVQESCEDPEEGGASEVTASSSKRRVTQEDLQTEERKKSRVEEGKTEEEEDEVSQPEGLDQEAEPEKQEAEASEEYVIDCSPPPPAPFDHRIVAAKPHLITNYYSINRDEIIGGGRFGQVHKCVENSSGLMLAAKIIKARSQKEKEVVRNEIQVMNQLNHSNLIQLYAAFESRHDIILVMEFVDGGELFDRIIDESYNLTELDTVLFIRQITEGLQYMHQMYILHLDLKPENILCVSRSTNKIKIIDFGLARRYKPREKLRINFGTPEFLAPEVINYEFVSFPTDMWSLGVITYMLLSGLSPFLGEDDNETLNNILSCKWSFEEEEFTDISEEAKDFITRLLVTSKRRGRLHNSSVDASLTGDAATRAAVKPDQ
ncbi:hypothetical protein GJAV_G00068810 [Gymnothorax javanicus]|nr:hypothetical protein GJAV_G00068810 [Gymnothorax javanicus]